jgi:hypothetical protein
MRARWTLCRRTLQASPTAALPLNSAKPRVLEGNNSHHPPDSHHLANRPTRVSVAQLSNASASPLPAPLHSDGRA